MQALIRTFHTDERGLETLEYVVIAALVAAILTLSLVALFTTIADKIKAINSSL